MITTFKVRKASTSYWIRKEVQDWVVASGPLGVENRIGLFSVPRPSFGPLRDLLTCDKGRSSPRRGERCPLAG